MIKVVKAKYLSVCDSCKSKICTHYIRAGRKYLHICTPCLLSTLKQCEEAVKHDSKKQMEQ